MLNVKSEKNNEKNQKTKMKILKRNISGMHQIIPCVIVLCLVCFCCFVCDKSGQRSERKDSLHHHPHQSQETFENVNQSRDFFCVFHQNITQSIE